jgi:hypothetical protein
MKSKTMQTMAMAFALVTGNLTALTAEAASITGTLGASTLSADTYTFTCPVGTVQSRIRVMDLNAILNLAATVYVTFGEDGSPTYAAADNESTTTGSPFVSNTLDRDGIYALTVRKSAVNPDDYIVEGRCLNALGADLATKLILKSNQ